jgi:group I intron endonuclease
MEYKVYLLENDINHKLYVGLTKNLERRFREHLRVSKYENTSESKHYLHQAIEKYGWKNFTHFIAFESSRKDFAIDQEKRYIRLFDTYESDYGYNLDKGGLGCDQIGGESHYMVKASDEKILNTMRKFMEEDKEMKEISKKLNMHPGSLRRIFSGKTRSYLQDEFKERYGYQFHSKYRRKDENKVRLAIKLHYKDDLHFRKISNILEVSDTTVMRWCKGERRKEIYESMKKKIKLWANKE